MRLLHSTLFRIEFFFSSCLVFVIFKILFFLLLSVEVMFIFWIYCATTLSTLTYKLFVIDCGNPAAPWEGWVAGMHNIYIIRWWMEDMAYVLGMRYINMFYTFRSDFSFEIVFSVRFGCCSEFVCALPLYSIWKIKFEKFSRFYFVELNVMCGNECGGLWKGGQCFLSVIPFTGTKAFIGWRVARLLLFIHNLFDFVIRYRIQASL